MPRPVHFEISVNDAAKAIAFYQAVFDWKFNKWEGPQEYWLVTTGAAPEHGIDGGMLLKRAPDHPATVNTVQVASVDDAVAAVLKAGGQCAVPKMPIPGVGWLAYCTDPDGNIFGVMHPDPSAA